jgi:DNA polymerase I-like protein with 3'-5' exonuclease and polymerase domains
MLTTKDLEAKFERLGLTYVFDTETALAPLSFQGWLQVRLLQFGNEDGYSFYLDTLELGTAHLQCIREFLEQEASVITGQALAFDYRVMLGCGIYLGGKPTVTHRPTFYDTYIASQLCYNGMAKLKHNLEAICNRELKVKIDKTLQSSDWMNEELTPDKLTYAMNDIKYTMDAAGVLHEKIHAQGLRTIYKIECALIPAVVEMEATGFRLDPDEIDDCIRMYTDETQSSRECFLETLDGRLQAHG